MSRLTVSADVLTASNVGRLQHELDSLGAAGPQGRPEGTPPPGYSAPARPANAPRPVNGPPLLPINRGGVAIPMNYFPQLQEVDSSSSEEEPATSRNSTFRLTVNGGVQVQGHGSMVGVDPINAATLTTNVVRTLGDQGLFNQQQQQHDDADAAGHRRRPRHFHINVNSGVSVVGNSNIIGSNLEEVVRYRRSLSQSTPGPNRQVNGSLPGSSSASAPPVPGSTQVNGTVPRQTPTQDSQQHGRGTTGNASGGGTSSNDNSDLYDAPPKPAGST